MRIKAQIYMDDMNLHFQEMAEDAMQVLPDLVDELEAVGIIVNKGESSALPPPGHEVTPTERRLFHDVDLPIVEDGITVVGVYREGHRLQSRTKLSLIHI